MQPTLLSYARPYILVAAFLSIFINLLQLTSPLYLLHIYNDIIPSGSIPTLVAISAFMIAAFAALNFLDFIRGWILSRLSAFLDLKESSVFISHLIDQASSHRAGEGNSQSDVVISDFEKVKRFLTGPLLTALMDLPFSFLYLLGLYLLHPLLFYFAISVMIVISILVLISSYVNRKTVTKSTKSNTDYQRLVSSMIASAQVIKVMGMRDRIVSKISVSRADISNQQKNLVITGSAMTSVVKFIRMFASSGVLGVGAYLVLIDELNAGYMFAAMILMGRALAPLDPITSQWQNLAEMRTSWRKVTDFLKDVQTKTSLKNNEIPNFALPVGKIELKNLSYSVSDANGKNIDLLKGISFTVNTGEVIGLFGPSGAGKTSLIRLITGLNQPSDGTVTFDGIPTHQLPYSQRGQLIGYLPQRIDLIPGSIADNISRFEETNIEAIQSAAKEAGIDQFITSLPESYDTEIDKITNMLAGGETQRLGLARAFYRHPKSLILDEPTSALDIGVKQRIAKTIHGFKQNNHSIILSTHDIEFLALCDRVIFLANGKIADQGDAKTIIGRIISTKQRKIKTVSKNDGPAKND